MVRRCPDVAPARRLLCPGDSPFQPVIPKLLADLYRSSEGTALTDIVKGLMSGSRLPKYFDRESDGQYACRTHRAADLFGYDRLKERLPRRTSAATKAALTSSRPSG